MFSISHTAPPRSSARRPLRTQTAWRCCSHTALTSTSVCTSWAGPLSWPRSESMPSGTWSCCWQGLIFCRKCETDKLIIKKEIKGWTREIWVDKKLIWIFGSIIYIIPFQSKLLSLAAGPRRRAQQRCAVQRDAAAHGRQYGLLLLRAAAPQIRRRDWNIDGADENVSTTFSSTRRYFLIKIFLLSSTPDDEWAR